MSSIYYYTAFNYHVPNDVPWHDGSVMMSQVHQHRSMRDVSNNEIFSHFSFFSARDCRCGAVMGN